MQTDTSVQRSGLQSEPKIDVRLADAGSDFVSLAQSLTLEQVRVLGQLVTPLDRSTSAVRIGFFASRQTDRSAILEHLVRPAESRKVRTPEHRKVVGLRIDTAAAPEGMLPWHYLIFSIIELLTESAMPTERSTLSELRNEISRLVRVYRRDPAAAAQPAVVFAKRFRTVFPKLILNTISLANSVLLVVLDRVDEAEPQDAAQWLEATQYFCNAPGCAVLLAASEAALIAKLSLSTGAVNGKELLTNWLTRRVEITNQTPFIDRTSPIQTRDFVRPVLPAETPVSAGATRITDVPTASANIIRDALQPNVNAIVTATSQWRTAMQVVMRRNEEGLSADISTSLVAKFIALRAVAPALYETVRYDAQVLVNLERAAHGDATSDAYQEWIIQSGKHPRLVGIFTAEPEFSSIDVRELAIGLRLIDPSAVNEERNAVQSGPLTRARPGRSARTSVQTRAAASPASDASWLLSSPYMATASAAASVFMLDRVGKLLIQAIDGPLFGGLLQPQLLPANSMLGGVLGNGLAVGAELFGLVLAVMISIFWGGLQRRQAYSISIGLIVGALASNLLDRLAYGNVLNYIHIASLPVFNLAHVGLIVGAALLVASLLRGPGSALPQAAE
ncbi:MAG: signal peptidase II [Chloroflexi bacterium]|nr:signal peptidase II [Chloroflexota bacterium]MCL5275816.1 signal peptidase II [Chloroflexota bacterium]